MPKRRAPREFEQERVLTAERERVAHDMHDLRLVIESLDVADGDLVTALASWRHGLERRLAGSGLRVIWQPTDVPRLTNVGPSDILNVLRLLDEPATNALRHANATTITIKYGMSDGAFFVSVIDDGVGGAQVSTAGNGLKNMHRRADALNAQLDIESGEEGTTIRLRFRRNPLSASGNS